MNWQSILTVLLTAATTILATTGAITTDESTQLTTTGASAITGVVSFVTAILAVVSRRKNEEGK